MNKFGILLSLSMLLSAFFGPLQGATIVNERPSTIPAIKEWKGGQGTLTLTQATRILYDDARLSDAAECLSQDIKTLTGLSLTTSLGKHPEAGDIFFTYKKIKKASAEAYTTNITRFVRIEGAEAGAMHAVQTLLQLMRSGSPTLPCGFIADQPDYPLRGFMIDCGRKFFPLDYLRHLVRTMAYYKMNTLSVHLNDNGFPYFFHENWDETPSAFRLESERFPGLTAEDGSYTKAEFRQFVLDAARLGVEVIPEIDVPAHSLAFTQYRPSLGSKEFGMDHLDLSNPEVIPFVDSLFTEYMEGPAPTFAGPRVHIGTDEYNNSRKETVEQFRTLTDHLITLVESYGKQASLWGALTHAKGDTPVKADKALTFVWNNHFADPDSMYRLGYQMVSIPDGMLYIVPAAGYYYDYLNIPYLYREWSPANIGGRRFRERDPQIQGGMFAVWNDIIGNGISVADVHHRVMPALQVVAEKCWAADTVRTLQQWQAAALTLSEAPGINDLGRYPAGTVLTEATVAPGSHRAVPFIGYPYRVSFDIETGNEARGTALFRSKDAEFYLSDPVTGHIGFVRDGYLFSFRHSLKTGSKEHIAICGNQHQTSLYVNGRLVETLGPDEHFGNRGKKYNIIRTLQFPLAETDAILQSRVTNLKVESLSEER